MSDESSKRVKSMTPLSVFLRDLTKDERIAFAVNCEVGYTYLFQLAASPNPNPTLRLALRIVDESNRIARRYGRAGLSLPDLLIGNPTGREQTHALRKKADELAAEPSTNRVRRDPGRSRGNRTQ